LGSLHSSTFYFFGDGPIKLAHCEKKKIWTWEAPGLINMKQKNLAEVKIPPGRYASVLNTKKLLNLRAWTWLYLAQGMSKLNSEIVILSWGYL